MPPRHPATRRGRRRSSSAIACSATAARPRPSPVCASHSRCCFPHHESRRLARLRDRFTTSTTTTTAAAPYPWRPWPFVVIVAVVAAVLVAMTSMARPSRHPCSTLISRTCTHGKFRWSWNRDSYRDSPGWGWKDVMGWDLIAPLCISGSHFTQSCSLHCIPAQSFVHVTSTYRLWPDTSKDSDISSTQLISVGKFVSFVFISHTMWWNVWCHFFWF